MNGYAVVTNEKQNKNLVFGHLWFYPKVSVINPELQKVFQKSI